MRSPLACLVPFGLARNVAVLCIVASPVLAQTQPDLANATLEDLMNITVTTASRNAETVAEAAAMVEVVTARQIRVRGYRSLADLLKDQLGVKADLGGDPDYPSQFTVMGSRGTSRIVLLMDGIRVSSPTGEPLPIMNNYPIHNARQVEIVYGPASALYGADAFSAVVNIISKDASGSEGVSFGSAGGQFGMINQTASYGTRLGQGASLTLSGQWFQDAQADLNDAYPDVFKGMQAQRTGVFNTVFGPMSPDQPVSPGYAAPIAAHSAHALLRAGGLQLTLFQNRARASTSAPNSPDNGVYNADAFQQNDLWVGAVSYTATVGRLTSASTVTMSRHVLSPDSGYRNVYSNLRKSYKYAYGSMLKAEQQVSWKPTERTVITAGTTHERFYAIPQGADLNEPVVSRNQPGTILGTNIEDEFVKVAYSNSGGYGQFQHALSSKVSLMAGARADYNTRYGTTFNPRVGVVMNPTRGTTIKALFGTAYLAPSPYQAYSHYGSFYSQDGGATYASDYWHVGNPQLEPQHKTTWQGSISQALSPSWNVSASVFRSRITNVIKQYDTEHAGPGTYHGWPVAYIDWSVNEGDETIRGGSLDFDFLKAWAAVRMSARAGVSLADGRVWNEDLPENGVQMGAMAPFQSRVGLDLDWHAWSGSARMMRFGKQRLMALAEAEGEPMRRTLDGFATLDLNLRRNRITRHVDLFVSLDNALNTRYYHINERAYLNDAELVGAPQNPRRLSVGIDLWFGRH